MGRAHAPDLTAPLCKNCHAEATEGQLREEVALSATDNLLDRVAAIFDALAAFFRFLADSLNQLAGQVREFVGSLDGKYPEWRSELSDGR
jgi:ABC-type transporter Mla subunit MlaD